MAAKVAVLSFFLLSVLGMPASAQTQAATGTARLRVHLDCGNCFQDFLRDEIRWLDFVRQPQDADVQVLTTNNQTGGGGQEIVLRLVGLGRFAGTTQELRAITAPAASEDERRREFLRVISVGLLSFAAREGLPATIQIEIESDEEDRAAAQESDPWNYWVFSIGADGMFQSEESSRESNLELEVTADRVTDNWNLAFGLSVEQQNETFDLDEDDPFEVTRTERGFDWFIAKSLGEHWSFGFTGDARESTFQNIKFQTEAAPAIEYNFFPYTQYASRQLRVGYSIGMVHNKYNEVTFFDLLEETRGQHELSVTLDQRERWGTLQAGVEWSQYLHDTSKSRLEFDGEISVRLLRGLSAELEVSASRIRDQISLPRRDATSEEVLLRLRELQSGHEVRASFGISYTFGSIFNNVVNPRFGGGQGGGGGGNN